MSDLSIPHPQGDPNQPRVVGGREIVDQRGKTRIVGPFYCSVCRKQFPHKSLTEIHLQCHMEKRLPCPFCEKLFKNKYVLKYHVEGAHRASLGNSLSRKAKAPPPARPEPRPIAIQCKYCGLQFKDHLVYQEHIRIHHAPKVPSRSGSQSCPMCQDTFTSLYELVRHLETSHNTHRPEPSPAHSSAKSILLSGGATLQISGASCVAKHPDRNVSPSGSESPDTSGDAYLRCDICDRGFGHLSLLRGHMLNEHHLYLICPSCNLILSDMEEMATHMEEVHATVKTYSCSVCGRCFVDERSNGLHLEAHKNGLADFSGCFQCSFCEALFDSERDCSSHEKSHPAAHSAAMGLGMPMEMPLS